MPKVRRQNLPPALLDHLIDRIRSRDIAAEELGRFADWLDSEPNVPAGKWFKTIPGNDRVRRSRFGENILASRTSPNRRRSAMTNPHEVYPPRRAFSTPLSAISVHPFLTL
jgi:hypothetical protein